MKFTPEHEALRQTWKTLIDREINPHVDEWEKAGMFPAHELFKKMGDAGLLGVDKPVQFGGSGLDFSYAMICSESLGLVNGGSIPMATGVQISMATPALARYGSDELRQEFLAPAISGDYVACLGVSETGAGSDVASIKTDARRVGGDWVINGGKMWTTNGAQADWMCLLANTGDGQAHKNKSLIVVPMKTKGITIAKKLDKLGMRASDTVQTFFDEVKVPVRYTIGQPGSGFIYQMQQFQEERLWAGAGTLMGCDRIINATIDYTRERKVFGRPLLDNQVIHFRLAELKSEVEALRSLVYRACEDYLAGTDVTMLASMAKLKAGRLRREVSDACLQYWGGAGYLWDSPVARSYRDGRLGSIGGGADEVMLQIISKLMGTLPRWATDEDAGSAPLRGAHDSSLRHAREGQAGGMGFSATLMTPPSATRNLHKLAGEARRAHGCALQESTPCNSPLNTPRSAAPCGPSSTRTSIRMSTNGKRTRSSPPTRSSRSWATPAFWASTSPSNSAAWVSTIPTPW